MKSYQAVELHVYGILGQRNDLDRGKKQPVENRQGKELRVQRCAMKAAWNRPQRCAWLQTKAGPEE